MVKKHRSRDDKCLPGVGGWWYGQSFIEWSCSLLEIRCAACFGLRVLIGLWYFFGGLPTGLRLLPDADLANGWILRSWLVLVVYPLKIPFSDPFPVCCGCCWLVLWPPLTCLFLSSLSFSVWLVLLLFKVVAVLLCFLLGTVSFMVELGVPKKKV